MRSCSALRHDRFCHLKTSCRIDRGHQAREHPPGQGRRGQDLRFWMRPGARCRNYSGVIYSGLACSTNFHSSEGCRESKRCSRDSYPESYITKYTSIRRSTLLWRSVSQYGVAYGSALRNYGTPLMPDWDVDIGHHHKFPLDYTPM